MAALSLLTALTQLKLTSAGSGAGRRQGQMLG
jgi:hypothetical protein